MKGRAIRTVIVLLALLIGNAGALAQIAELAPKLIPEATKAREALLNHPTLAPFEIEAAIRDALRDASAIPEGPDLFARKRAALAVLEPKLGSLREIPSIRLHLLLGALASEEGNKADETYHGAYAAAILGCITADADGTSPRNAFRVALIDDEYGLFTFMSIRVQPNQRVAREIDGRNYDVWTLRSRAGEERKMYFDYTAIQESTDRVLRARVKAAEETTPTPPPPVRKAE